MTMKYEGLILFGQNVEITGRGIAGPRLRTAASKSGFNIFVTDITGHLTTEQLLELIDIFVKQGIKFIGISVNWVGNSKDSKAVANRPGHTWFNEDFFQKVNQLYPELLIITGGHQLPDTENKKLLLKYVDFHFNGFSDLSFVEFLKYINNQPHNLIYEKMANLKGYVIDSNKNYPIADPNTIETVFIPEDNFEPHQSLPIELSRGCIFRCAFCTHPFQGKKSYDSYQRTSENIAVELKRNYDLFGTTRYVLMDDTFNDSIEKIDRLRKAIDLAKLPKFEYVCYIKPELLVTKPETIQMLADIGLRGAFLGLESFNNKTRQVIGRGVKIERIKESVFKLSEVNNRQVRVHGSFIVGLPYETKEDLDNTWEFLQSNVRNFCHSWFFKNLTLWNRQYELGEKSLFELSPETYGYKLSNEKDWESEFWTNKTAKEYATYLNKNSINYCGGWRVATAWNMNISDNDINNKLWTGANNLLKSVEITKQRSQTEFMDLVKKYKQYS